MLGINVIVRKGIKPSNRIERKYMPKNSQMTFLYSNLTSILPEPVIGLIHEYHIALDEVADFLKFVAEGEQDKAEAMLKGNPALALAPGDVTDLSKRAFPNITGFQYAVWALVWHMWTMIRKYLPDKAAQELAQEFETGPWVTQHGIHANLNIIIQAYQTMIDLYNAAQYAECNMALVQKVGGAQLLLPAHVINEYCHPTRLFYLEPNFKDDTALPRTRTLDEGEWFTAECSGGKLGEKFAWTGRRGGSGGWMGIALMASCDHDILSDLNVIRTAQREELIDELNSKNVKRKVA